jgi:purine-binding chemotaxis protein CheW
MNDSIHFLVFTLDDQRYALYLSAVEKTVRAVEVTPLPKCPDIVLGVINFRGRVVPVINIRKRFRLPEREMELSDHLIIARTSRRSVALAVDSVLDILKLADRDIIPAGEVLPAMDYVQGVAKLQDGMVLIHDLDRFLDLEEEKALDAAMSHNPNA